MFLARACSTVKRVTSELLHVDPAGCFAHRGRLTDCSAPDETPVAIADSDQSGIDKDQDVQGTNLHDEDV